MEKVYSHFLDKNFLKINPVDILKLLMALKCKDKANDLTIYIFVLLYYYVKSIFNRVLLIYKINDECLLLCY